MQQVNKFSYMGSERPALMGEVHGGAQFPQIEGLIHAYWLRDTLLIPDGALYFQAEFTGLPPDKVFGLHVHDGVICGAAEGDQQFTEAGGHLSLCPEGTWCARHPYHAGDLPPIISDSTGYAAMQVYIGKAQIADFSGKPIILHSMPDDFSTQPAGNSGKRIACGIFMEVL